MAKETKNKKEKKHFFKDFKVELKKVIWPTPKQLVNNTIAVVTIVLITAIIVFVLDFAFESMNTYGINKLKEMVELKNEVSNETSDVTSNEQVNVNTQTEATVNEEDKTSENVSE